LSGRVVDPRDLVAFEGHGEVEEAGSPDAVVDGHDVPRRRDHEHERVPIAVGRPGARARGRAHQQADGHDRGQYHPLHLLPNPPDRLRINPNPSSSTTLLATVWVAA